MAKLVSSQEWERRKTIEAIHEEGAVRYGADWFHANIDAVAVLQQAGLTPNDYKALGARIALRLCTWRERGRKEGSEGLLIYRLLKQLKEERENGSSA